MKIMRPPKNGSSSSTSETTTNVTTTTPTSSKEYTTTDPTTTTVENDDDTNNDNDTTTTSNNNRITSSTTTIPLPLTTPTPLSNNIVIGTILHIVKGNIGPGCLSLPWAISQFVLFFQSNNNSNNYQHQHSSNSSPTSTTTTGSSSSSTNHNDNNNHNHHNSNAGLWYGIFAIILLSIWTSYSCLCIVWIKQYIIQRQQQRQHECEQPNDPEQNQQQRGIHSINDKTTTTTDNNTSTDGRSYNRNCSLSLSDSNSYTRNTNSTKANDPKLHNNNNNNSNDNNKTDNFDYYDSSPNHHYYGVDPLLPVPINDISTSIPSLIVPQSISVQQQQQPPTPEREQHHPPSSLLPNYEKDGRIWTTSNSKNDTNDSAKTATNSSSHSSCSTTMVVTYPEVGRHIVMQYPNCIANGITICIAILQLAICTVFVSFITENIYAIIVSTISTSRHTHNFIPSRTLLSTILLPVLLSLSLMPTLQQLTPITAIGTMSLLIGFILLSIVIVMYQQQQPQPEHSLSDDIIHQTNETIVTNPDVTSSSTSTLSSSSSSSSSSYLQLALGLCAILYSFEGIGLVLPIETSLSQMLTSNNNNQRKKWYYQFEVIYLFSMTIVTIVLCIIPIICIRTFGTISNGSITAFVLQQIHTNNNDIPNYNNNNSTNNTINSDLYNYYYDTNNTTFNVASTTTENNSASNNSHRSSNIIVWIQMANIAVSLSVICTYPLQLFPAIQILGPLIAATTGSSSKYCSIVFSTISKYCCCRYHNYFSWYYPTYHPILTRTSITTNTTSIDLEDDGTSDPSPTVGRLVVVPDDPHEETRHPTDISTNQDIPLNSKPDQQYHVHDFGGMIPDDRNSSTTEDDNNNNTDSLFRMSKDDDDSRMLLSTSIVNPTNNDNNNNNNGIKGDTIQFRIVLVVLTYIISVCIPNVQVLISLAGAIAGSSVALLLPPILELSYLHHLEQDELHNINNNDDDDDESNTTLIDIANTTIHSNQTTDVLSQQQSVIDPSENQDSNLDGSMRRSDGTVLLLRLKNPNDDAIGVFKENANNVRRQQQKRRLYYYYMIRRWICYGSFLGGFVLCCLGTYASLLDIYHLYTNKSHN